MSEIPSQFQPKEVEKRIFDSWMEGGYFQPSLESDAAPYTIVIPPPNVTGSLHMGHALNDTIQDVLIRRQRMMGKPTKWLVGTDHAGIATQNKVEQRLATQGKSRNDLGREAFIQACWEWRDEYGSTIVEQLKAMGCSCDYSDEWFTMDPSYQRAVREVFVDWHDRGLIYRGNRIINWCPRCTTALSDIEVEHEDEQGKLYQIRYPLTHPVGETTHAVIATTRPETMLGDAGIAVSPKDPRYVDLIGATAVLPLVGREIPIVADDFVDPEFGTGMVKITPAHDPNDFDMGQRHDLEQVNIFTETGTVNENGGRFTGMDRYEARKAVLADLEEQGFLVDVLDHDHSVGHCYRCATVIEPWLSEQWFVDMKPLAEPAIQAVRDGRVVFHPARWDKVYYHWMENIRDWCISRQLWWGHRIPVFYCDECGLVKASRDDLDTCPQCAGPMRQDEDVLDTWFSSQLWPFATFGWPDETPDLQRFYPTAVLSTARDILFLWVARMVMSGMDFMDGQVPFKDVIIHPTVFNAEGRRMSKSLGTGVDPLDLMDQYGADGMRFGLMLQVTGVQDLKFSEEKLVSSRNFANKIWNASRFVLMNAEGYEPGAPQPTTVADRWILSRLARVTAKLDESLDTYEFGEASRELYDFFWNEYCDWYIELSKSRLQGDDPAERLAAQRMLVFVLDRALRLLHPMMPFVTEEIWRRLPLPAADAAPSLMVAPWPSADELAVHLDAGAERAIEMVKAIVSAVRSTRARYGISPREALPVLVRAAGTDDESLLLAEAAIVTGLANASSLEVVGAGQPPKQAAVTVSGGLEIFVPLEGLVDLDAELARLTKERAKVAGEHEKLARKLSNEGFLAKAAADIIEKDRAKAAELADELRALELQIEALS